MTVTDQAAAEVKFRELEPREVLLARLFDAMEAADEAVKGLVKHDLTALVPELEAARAEAEAALEAAEKAVEEPEAQVRAAEAGVRECAEKMTELAGSLADPDLHLRVESRRWYAEYERERNELQKKLDFAQLVAGPLHHARQEARNAYVQCCADLRALGLQIAYFPYGPDGQETDSYKLWRRDRGSLFPLLLNWDRESSEWPAAMTALRLACLATGYRGEDLPTEAEKAAWALKNSGMADAMSTPPAPAPSMAEVIALDKAGIVNAALERSSSRIEDYRTAPAVPRNARVADYRQVPTARDLGIR